MNASDCSGPGSDCHGRRAERAAVRDFFARVGHGDEVLAEVRRAMRDVGQTGNDVLVLHHCLDVPLVRAAEWLGIPESVAVEALAEAEALVAPLIPN